MSLVEWADVLRASHDFPYAVIEHNDWKNNRPLGDLDSLDGLIWHHDASEEGPSPGDVEWLITAYNAERPSAQIIVGYGGVWHFVGSGMAYHAGNVRGHLGNRTTVGVETDHTTYEVMSPALKDSVERGFAVICRHEGWTADHVTFHKIEAVPKGRKTDPYFSGDPDDQSTWNSELATERTIIQGYIDGNNVINPPSTGEDDDMYHTYQSNAGAEKDCIWLAVPGYFEPLESMEEYNTLVNKRAAAAVQIVNERELDVLRAVYRNKSALGVGLVSLVDGKSYTVAQYIQSIDQRVLELTARDAGHFLDTETVPSLVVPGSAPTVRQMLGYTNLAAERAAGTVITPPLG